MDLLTKTRILFCFLLIFYISVALISGSSPDSCEVRVGREYQSDVPINYFLKSLLYHSQQQYAQEIPVNTDAANYFAALFDSVRELISDINIESPREYCQHFVGQERLCMGALSLYRVQNITDIDEHSDLLGEEVFEHIYFTRLYEKIPEYVMQLIGRQDAAVIATMYSYFKYFLNLVQTFDPNLFPDVSYYCAHQDDFLRLF